MYIYLSIISININMCPKFVDFVFVSTPQRKSHPSTAITSPGKWVGSPTFANKWIRSPLEKQEETSRNTKNVLTCPVNHGVVYVDRSWSYFSTTVLEDLGFPKSPRGTCTWVMVRQKDHLLLARWGSANDRRRCSTFVNPFGPHRISIVCPDFPPYLLPNVLPDVLP